MNDPCDRGFPLCLTVRFGPFHISLCLIVRLGRRQHQPPIAATLGLTAETPIPKGVDHAS
jgi:hypothetical protein